MVFMILFISSTLYNIKLSPPGLVYVFIMAKDINLRLSFIIRYVVIKIL